MLPLSQALNPLNLNVSTDEVAAGFGDRDEMVAALFVEAGGCYFDLPGVIAWDEARDARLYAGPHPVVAHPPCQRWGRFWHGSTRKPHQFTLGADLGCFASALAAVRKFGGVLEHPKDSRAWSHFGLNKPPANGGWIAADWQGGWTCCVEQGHYGHLSRKPTWLYASKVSDLPELRWGRGEQRIHPRALELHGYEKARRIGMMAMVGGKDKTKIRNATPIEFRDVLLSIARSVAPSESVGAIRRRAVFSEFIVAAAGACQGSAIASTASPCQGLSGRVVSVKDNMRVRFHASKDAVESAPCLYPRRMDLAK